MLTRLDHRRPEVRFQAVQLRFGGGQPLARFRPHQPVLAEELAGARVLQPVDILQRGYVDGDEPGVVVLQSVGVEPLAENEFGLQLHCGPLKALLVPGRQLGQKTRISAIR